MITDLANFKSEGTIASLAPTVTSLFATATPSLASEPPLESVTKMRQHVLGDEPIGRCLLFCPDALGVHIWPSCEHHIKAISEIAVLRIALLSVAPSKTPVCFASMFTGGQPRDHGIRKYERPVLACETLFDVLLRANKKIAIIAVADSSVDLIFRDRDMDYFSERHDREVMDQAIAVIQENRHDLIVVYQQEYDDLLHATNPFSQDCIRAVGNHVASFAAISQTAMKVWSDHNNAIIFATDHGAHVDPTSGHGNHGEDIPEDMRLFHWYGINARQNPKRRKDE